MPETEYTAVASGSESGSRDVSLEAKREQVIGSGEYDEKHPGDDLAIKIVRWIHLTLRRLRCM